MLLLKKLTPSHLLKFFALLFWALSFIFLGTLLTLHSGNSLFQHTMRGTEYRWDYEAMFTAVYFVWGIFCWKASSNPQKHILFIDFTIWASILHAVVMTTVGIFRQGEFSHLLADSLLLLLPALILWYVKAKSPKQPSS